jgi:hypothetical protein
MTIDPNPALNSALASKLARAALGHVEREYPNVLVHALSGPEDLGAPHVLHPIFFGSYDWHSCVHGHWLLARLLRLMPDLPEAPAIRTHFNQAFTVQKIAGELAYLARPTSAGFERPYGWAWLLMLAGELRQHAGAEAHVWDLALRPLADAFVIRFEAFLPKADYPVRAGVHSNTAFALALAHGHAKTTQNGAFADLIEAKALSWYAQDAACQAWEPSGDDFLSPALIEADLMRLILPPAEFRGWFARFLPNVAQGEPATLFRPARVSDRGDGKIAHLDGLSLSRAWCWRGVARAAGEDAALRQAAEAAADRHLAASLPHVTGDYMGEHWLASFALLALLA